MIVRDAILQYVKTDVEQAHSAGELKQTLAKKTKQIARIAAKAADGKPVRVYFTQERFPIRHYGAAIFPAGEYQALRIDIGKAQGITGGALSIQNYVISQKKSESFPCIL
ncbi:MAG: stage II sporulation protein R [Anaerobutyricum soehngenii]